jgi:hypothetical protein
MRRREAPRRHALAAGASQAGVATPGRSYRIVGTLLRTARAIATRALSRGQRSGTDARSRRRALAADIPQYRSTTCIHYNLFLKARKRTCTQLCNLPEWVRGINPRHIELLRHLFDAVAHGCERHDEAQPLCTCSSLKSGACSDSRSDRNARPSSVRAALLGLSIARSATVAATAQPRQRSHCTQRSPPVDCA